jgi:hypothetical protein
MGGCRSRWSATRCNLADTRGDLRVGLRSQDARARARWLGEKIMDWLQFISSTLVGFAWPSVLIVLMVILRKQISALAGRIEEVTLPGGAKAKFEKAIGEAREKAEKIEPAARDTSTAETQPQDSFLYLANNFPEAAIMESFREVERTLWEMVPFLGLPTKGRSPPYVIEEMQRKRYSMTIRRICFTNFARPEISQRMLAMQTESAQGTPSNFESKPGH